MPYLPDPVWTYCILRQLSALRVRQPHLHHIGAASIDVSVCLYELMPWNHFPPRGLPLQRFLSTQNFDILQLVTGTVTNTKNDPLV